MRPGRWAGSLAWYAFYSMLAQARMRHDKRGHAARANHDSASAFVAFMYTMMVARRCVREVSCGGNMHIRA